MSHELTQNFTEDRFRVLLSVICSGNCSQKTEEVLVQSKLNVLQLRAGASRGHAEALRIPSPCVAAHEAERNLSSKTSQVIC